MKISSREKSSDHVIGDGEFRLNLSLEQMQLITAYLAWTDMGGSGVYGRAAYNLFSAIERKLGSFFIDNAINEAGLTGCKLDDNDVIVEILQNNFLIAALK